MQNCCFFADIQSFTAMSIIVAINPGFGSSIGVFKDGKPVVCVEEERFNRVKNWLGFPEKAFAFLLENGYFSIEDTTTFALTNDGVIPTKDRDAFYAYYDEYFEAGVKLSQSPREVDKYLLKNKLYKTSLYQMVKGGKSTSDGTNLHVEQLKQLGVPEAKISCVEHHLCHAAAAYYGLGKDLDKPYLVFSLDGGGDGLTAAVYKAQNGKMELLNSSDAYSIGNIFSATTYYLGFTPHEHEYKLMGLAPYVKERYAGRCLPFFREHLTVDATSGEFVNPKPLNHAIYFASMINGLRRERFDNVSNSLQLFCEEIVEQWVKANVKKYGIDDILCSGGVFMNVKMNMLLAQLDEVKSMNVFPSCGDETNIFGAAYSLHNATTPELDLLKEFCLGTSLTNTEATLAQYADKITYEKVDDVNREVAQLLADDNIVARCTGPMEFGARALGNRSIMANPSNLANVAKINQAIKNRDFWMPFAPAMRNEDVHEYVELPKSLEGQLSPYMMFAMPVHEHKADDMICGVHQADRTARVESIDKDRCPDFHEIITHFREITGRGVVLNTSFNLHGFPIVENEVQAIDVLLASQLDVLVINDYLIRRKG